MPISESPQAIISRGETLLADGRLVEASEAFAEALRLRPRDSAAWRGLGKAQLDLGDQSAAKASFAQALAIVPYDRYAAHMLASLSGQTDKGATGYVADLFDTYADSFDTHLTSTLQYRIPQAIRSLLAGRAPFATVLDLGCGTGLVGAALGDLVAAIDGIDIAPRMVRKAHERGIYRHLLTGDILDSLAADPALRGPYDMIAAADVFVYVGGLEPIFAAVRAILAARGLFVFSVETAPGDGVALRSNGRFAHATAYIERLAEAHGLDILARQQHPIRHERDQPIAGELFLLARN